jgi:hypothetical protein
MADYYAQKKVIKMNKNNEQHQFKNIINATESNIAVLMNIITTEEEQGECTCSLHEIVLEMQTSLLVFKKTKDEDLIEYHVSQVNEIATQIYNYLN